MQRNAVLSAFLLLYNHHHRRRAMSDYEDDEDDAYNPYESDDEMVLDVGSYFHIRFECLTPF